MKKTFLLAALTAYLQVSRSGQSLANDSTSSAAPANCNVRSFGAAGDGKADDRDSIQKAIDHCSAAGGGTVEVPPGVYRSCGIMLRNHVHLQLDDGATLQGSQQNQ